MKIFGIVMLICGTTSLVIGIFWAAFLRDGLAPGFTPSTGYTAVIRTISDGAYSITFGTLMIITGIVCFYKSRKYHPETEL